MRENYQLIRVIHLLNYKDLWQFAVIGGMRREYHRRGCGEGRCVREDCTEPREEVGEGTRCNCSRAL